MNTAVYETQGLYPTSRSKQWKTHRAGLTLDRAIRCYQWFKYTTMEPVKNGPNDARIFNRATGEILVPPVVLPKMLFGTLVVPCTTKDWEARLYRDISYDYDRTEKSMRDGSIQFSYEGGDVIGFRLPDGTYRIRPCYYVLAD